jgi:hypothetical protein
MKKLFFLSVLLLSFATAQDATAQGKEVVSPLLPGTLPPTVAISPRIIETYGDYYLKARLVLQGTYGPDFDWLLPAHTEPHLQSRWNQLVEYGVSRWNRYYALQQKANRNAVENRELQEFTALVESNLKYLEALTPESKKRADEEAAQRSVQRIAAAEAEKRARAYENLVNSPGELRKFLGELSQRYQPNASVNDPAKAQNGTAQGAPNNTSLDDLVKLALLQAAQNQRIIEQNQQIISQLDRLILK